MIFFVPSFLRYCYHEHWKSTFHTEYAVSRKPLTVKKISQMNNTMLNSLGSIKVDLKKRYTRIVYIVNQANIVVILVMAHRRALRGAAAPRTADPTVHADGTTPTQVHPCTISASPLSLPRPNQPVHGKVQQKIIIIFINFERTPEIHFVWDKNTIIDRLTLTHCMSESFIQKKNEDPLK